MSLKIPLLTRDMYDMLLPIFLPAVSKNGLFYNTYCNNILKFQSHFDMIFLEEVTMMIYLCEMRSYN